MYIFNLNQWMSRLICLLLLHFSLSAYATGNVNPLGIERGNSDRYDSSFGDARTKVPGKPPPVKLKCDAMVYWTCSRMGETDEAVISPKRIKKGVDGNDDVLVALIQTDGSIYLQEFDAAKSDDDNISFTLPPWLVASGLSGYELAGTGCSVSIQPVLDQEGAVVDWNLEVIGTDAVPGVLKKCGGKSPKKGKQDTKPSKTKGPDGGVAHGPRPKH